MPRNWHFNNVNYCLVNQLIVQPLSILQYVAQGNGAPGGSLHRHLPHVIIRLRCRDNRKCILSAPAVIYLRHNPWNAHTITKRCKNKINCIQRRKFSPRQRNTHFLGDNSPHVHLTSDEVRTSPFCMVCFFLHLKAHVRRGLGQPWRVENLVTSSRQWQSV